MKERKIPLNRKESFYTGTVLPGIICSDDFKHFSKFLEVIGLGDLQLDLQRPSESVQFYTEYCLAFALAVPRAPVDLKKLCLGNDTPDIMILVKGKTRRVLVVIEAKMFSVVTPDSLKIQLKNQRNNVIDGLRQWLGLKAADIHHMALLPQPLLSKMGTWEQEGVQITTWEDILEAFKPLDVPRHWIKALDEALKDFTHFASTIKFGEKKNDLMCGAEIYDGNYPFDTPAPLVV